MNSDDNTAYTRWYAKIELIDETVYSFGKYMNDHPIFARFMVIFWLPMPFLIAFEIFDDHRWLFPIYIMLCLWGAHRWRRESNLPKEPPPRNHHPLI